MLPFSEHKIICMTNKGAWIRTGVDGDGNCFFHSYVYSLEATRFRSLSYEDRLKHVMTVKKYFSIHITEQDIIELIDVNNFEYLTNQIEKWIHPKKGPDLSNQPLLSIKGYVDLLYVSYPELKQDEQFQSKLNYLYQTYHKQIQQYTERDGTWMFDSLIHLFMKKMDINIVLVSHETNKQITHYPSLDTKYTIFIYHIHDHFESIGLFHNNIMKRIFEEIRNFP